MSNNRLPRVVDLNITSTQQKLKRLSKEVQEAEELLSFLQKFQKALSKGNDAKIEEYISQLFDRKW